MSENIKPMRVETKSSEKGEKEIPPQRVYGGFEEVYEGKAQKGKKGTFLAKAFVISLVTVFIIGSFYDVYIKFSEMFKNSFVLGVVYIVGIVVFSAILLYFFYRQYNGYRKLKDIENRQQKAKEFVKNPTDEVFGFAKAVLQDYKEHQDKDIRQKALLLEKELDEKVLMSDEVLSVLDEKLFSLLDKKAYEIISKYSTQTALSTAISPVALIDMLLILSRSWAMISEIAKLYGFKPNFTGKMILLKRVSFNLVFASITDLASDYLSGIVGTSVLSKLSYHSAQGLANGILTARVGVASVRACRVIYEKKRINYVKYIVKKLLDTLLGKNQAVNL